MNWRRGLVRAWLIASAIWLVVAAVGLSVPQSLIDVMISWPEAIRYAAATNPLPPSSPFVWPPAVSDIDAHRIAVANLWHFVLFGFGGPAAILVLGIAAWWVAQGFKPKSPRVDP
jgi:hypothetical protein